MIKIQTPRMAIEEVLMFRCGKKQSYDLAIKIEEALEPYLIGDNNRTTDRLDALNVSVGALTDVTSNLMERVKKLENPERECVKMKTADRFRIEVMKNKSSHWKQWDSYPEFEHSRQWADSFFQNPANELIAVRIVTATKNGTDELVYLKRKVEE